MSENVVANCTEPLWLAITGSDKEDVRIRELLLAAYTSIAPPIGCPTNEVSVTE
jgi:hypothetical protein